MLCLRVVVPKVLFECWNHCKSLQGWGACLERVSQWCHSYCSARSTQRFFNIPGGSGAFVRLGKACNLSSGIPDEAKSHFALKSTLSFFCKISIFPNPSKAPTTRYAKKSLGAPGHNPQIGKHYLRETKLLRVWTHQYDYLLLLPRHCWKYPEIAG